MIIDFKKVSVNRKYRTFIIQCSSRTSCNLKQLDLLFFSMLLSSRKFIVRFISVLLIFTSFQTAFSSSMVLNCEMKDMDYSMMVMDQSVSAHDCDHHGHEKECPSSSCADSQCVSSVIGLIPSVSLLVNASDSSNFRLSNDFLVSQFRSSLFRPPRV
jgi:hypothetical protein